MPELAFEILTPEGLTNRRIQDLGVLAGQLSSSFRGRDTVERDQEIAGNLEAVLAAPDETALFIHEDNGHIISTATANVLQTDGWVDDVVTLEAARGGGLGRSVMGSMHEWLLEHGAITALLTSKPEREAAGTLYSKLRYEVGGTVWRAPLVAEDILETLAKVTRTHEQLTPHTEFATGTNIFDTPYAVLTGVCKILTGNKAWISPDVDYSRAPALSLALRTGNAMLQADHVDSANIYFGPDMILTEGLLGALAANGYEQRKTRLYAFDLVNAE